MSKKAKKTVKRAPKAASRAPALAGIVAASPIWRMIMSKEQIAGIVRAVVAAVGGYFVGKGMLDGATMETIAGAVATLATAVWSVWSKKA